MKSIRFALSLLLLIALSACGGISTPSGPTPTLLASQGADSAPTVTEIVTLTATSTENAPTLATTPEPETQPPAVVVFQSGDPTSIIVIDPASGQSALFLSPAPEIIGGANSVDTVQGKLYALIEGGTEGDQYVIGEITPAGVRPLFEEQLILGSVITNPYQDPNSNLVQLVFGTVEDSTARLITKAVGGAVSDGSIVVEQVLLDGSYFVPVRWSSDGARIYYSQERPVAPAYSSILGGFSTLYVYQEMKSEGMALITSDEISGDRCLDDLSPNETLVAYHCTAAGIGILDLVNSEEVAIIYLPNDLTGWTLVGSTRFSPDSSRIAFAAARGDSTNEQGWVLVTDDLNGASRLIATAPVGDYYTVETWLDANSLILQSHGDTPAVWLIRLDGSDPVKLADGVFLDLMR